LRTDGGRTWRASYVHGSFAEGFHFRTPTRGYIDIAEPRGDSRYVTERYVTASGGATWTRGGRESKLLRRRHAVRAYVPGPLGPGDQIVALERTGDYGRHWTPVRLPGNPDVKQLKSFGHLLVVVALVFEPHGRYRLAIYVSHDSGNHWTQRLAPRRIQPGGPQDACCFNVSAPVAGALFALGDKLYVTHDVGRTWNAVPAYGLHFRGWDPAPIDFVDARVGWVIGGSTLYRTTDGGRYWVPAGPRLPKKHERG
jgi:hypothetical protein